MTNAIDHIEKPHRQPKNNAEILANEQILINIQKMIKYQQDVIDFLFPNAKKTMRAANNEHKKH